jgi:hypothetical protein
MFHMTMRRVAVLLAATVAAAGAPAVLATPATAVTRAQDTIDFTLKRKPYPAANAIPLTKASMTSVIKNGNYQAQRRGGCGAAKADSTPSDWYCFDPKDRSSRKDKGDAAPVWIPQGVTSTADAARNERWNGLDAVVVGWYDDADVQGIRITVLNKSTGKYRNVLLVNPYYEGSTPSFRAVNIAKPDGSGSESVHIGGIAWYGRRLYVADTKYGIREFSLDNIYDLAKSGNGYTDQERLIGYRNPRVASDPDRPAGYYAHGYRYIMAQTAMWQHKGAPSNRAGWCKDAGGNPRFSYMSVDRKSSPNQLIVGEFCPSTEETNGRVVAYNMAGQQPVVDRDGWARPDELYKLPVASVQGAASDGRYWYFNSSDGSKGGTVRRAVVRSGLLKVNGSAHTPVGPEDLSYTRSTRNLWSVTEYLNPGRMLYSLPASSVH